MSRFKQTFGINEDAKSVQDNAREKFQALDTVPFLRGTLLKNVPLSRSPRDVAHRLERNYEGFIVTRQPQGSEAEPWQNWTPTISGDGGLTWTGLSVVLATFSRMGSICRLHFRFSGTLGGTASGSVNIGNLPFSGFDNTGVGASLLQPVGMVWFVSTVLDNGYCGFVRNVNFTTLSVFRRDQTNFPTAGSLTVTGNIEYRMNDSDAYYGPGVSVLEAPQDIKSSIIRLQADVPGNYDIWVF